jgi:hypothetical protein
MISQNTLIKICLEEARKSDNRHRLGAVYAIYNIITKGDLLYNGTLLG